MSYEKAPHQLISDIGITLAARGLYPLIRHLIWKAGAQNGDTMTGELPPLTEIAQTAGCSERALRDYLRELKLAGWLTTRRGSRTRPQTYTIYLDPRPAESAARVRQNPPLSRARDPFTDLEQDTEGEAKASPSGGRPRNLVFDTLAEETGENPAAAGGKIGKAVKAIREAEADTIREKCEEFLAGNPQYDEVPRDRIDGYLAAKIRVRAQRYRECRPDWELTATALATHWLRIPTWEPRSEGRAGLTPSELARLELG